MALIAAFAGLAWAGIVGLIFLLNVGDYAEFWFPARVITYALLLIAPTLTFMPMGRALGIPLYGYWSVVSWAAFGFVFAFLTPDPTRSRDENWGLLILLLICLFAVVVSLFLPIFYAVGTTIFANASRPARYDLRRAMREAVMLGFYFLLVAFMQLLGNLAWLQALLLLLIVVTIELLILSRGRTR
ncbi:MAG: hypothetical protein WCS37_10530 [Chloroflexota bacterium]|nr:hypothetical protein [Chloroflexota bacterium]